MFKRGTRDLQRGQTGLGGYAAAFLVLLASLLLTFLGWRFAESQIRRAGLRQVREESKRLCQALIERLAHSEALLTQAAATYPAFGGKPNAEWQQYLASLPLGIPGGMVQAVTFEPSSTAASNRARSGHQTVVLRLPANATTKAGFELLVPVYSAVDLAPSQPPVGWLAAHMTLSGLMADLASSGSLPSGARVSIATGPLRAELEGDANPGLIRKSASRDLKARADFEFAGAAWNVAVAAPDPSRLPWQSNPASEFLLAGIGASFVVFGAALLGTAGRRRRGARFTEPEIRLRAAFDASPDAMFTLDERRQIQTCNVAAQELTGFEREALVGRRITELIPELPLPHGQESGLGTVVREKSLESRRCTIHRQDGSTLTTEVSLRTIRNGGRAWFVVVARRSAGSRAAESATREAEQVFNLVACAVHDGLWDWNLRSSKITFSTRWKTMLGHSEQEISDEPEEWFRRIHPEDREDLQARLLGHLQGRSQHFESEHRMLHRDGSYRWVLSHAVAVRDLAGHAIRIVGSQSDITARKSTERRLLRAALHDPLTGLPNRSYFMQQLENAHHRVSEHPDYLFGLLFLDVDRFKRVNDSLGHGVGDELLISIAKRLERCVRPGDVVARIGGDEFAVLLSGLKDRKEVTRIAERIQTDLAQAHRVSEQEIFVAVSIGIALNTSSQEKPGDLVRNADAAMHRAKSHGKARFELFDRNLRNDATATLHVESALRRALERKELLIHYQPIVSLASGKITSCEALIRWKHPERGMILPAEFIPEAEESGLITPLSEWILQQACRQAQAWREAGLPPIRVSINVSPRFVKEPTFLASVTDALTASGLDASLLQLELTESVLMENADATIRPLVELYTKGVHISLDDFGTGYSSLVYLRRYPISNLKIDESLVRNIATDLGDAAIASGLIALAHSLDMKVIVEGVETAEQLSFLRAKQCDEVQGYFLSPPLDSEDFFQLLKNGHDLESLLSQRAAAAHV